MRDYRRLAARLFNAPLLATPEAASAVADFLAARIAGESLRANDGFDGFRGSGDDAPYTVDEEGIATIPVHGELVNRGSWMDAMSGLTSYKALGAALDAAAADYRVRGIVLDIDSPGGEAAGAMETAAKVRQVAGVKKVVAYVDALAASAAYAIASGASEIVATPSATLGSIGVVWLHLDRSQAMKERGVKPTLLHAGAYKIDGNALSPLPDDARARIQAQIDEVYGLFVSTVGAHRPALGHAGARRTEAAVYIGERAVESSLADRVGGPEAIRAAFPRKSLFNPLRSAKMANDELIHSQAALDAAVAAARRESEAAAATAVAAARQDERARIRAILDGEPAKDKQKLARHFALTTDMSPESAAAALAAGAPETAPAPSRMDRVPALDIRPGASQTQGDPQAEIDAGYKAIADKLNRGVPARFRRAG